MISALLHQQLACLPLPRYQSLLASPFWHFFCRFLLSAFFFTAFFAFRASSSLAYYLRLFLWRSCLRRCLFLSGFLLPFAFAFDGSAFSDALIRCGALSSDGFIASLDAGASAPSLPASTATASCLLPRPRVCDVLIACALHHHHLWLAAGRVSWRGFCILIL